MWKDCLAGFFVASLLLLPALARVTVVGSITAQNFENKTIIITTEEGEEITFTITDETIITRVGKVIAMEELHIGDKVVITYDPDTMIAATVGVP